jgi:hypothetical protein
VCMGLVLVFVVVAAMPVGFWVNLLHSLRNLTSFTSLTILDGGKSTLSQPEVLHILCVAICLVQVVELQEWC